MTDSQNQKVMINLGSGHYRIEGWVNVDLDLECRPEVCADFNFDLPFRSSSTDFIHTEDFIDTLELHQAEQFMCECYRILKPGGAMRVLTPDVEKLASMYLHQPEELKALWRDHVRVPLVFGTAAEILNVGMRFTNHTFLYDAETFALLAAKSGFECKRVTYQLSDFPELRGHDLRSPDDALSLYHDCYKAG